MGMPDLKLIWKIMDGALSYDNRTVDTYCQGEFSGCLLVIAVRPPTCCGWRIVISPVIPLGSRPCADSAMRNLVAFALASRMFLNLADFKGMRTRMRFSVKTGRVAAPGARHPFFERASN
jgi:hypothetical protein